MEQLQDKKSNEHRLLVADMNEDVCSIKKSTLHPGKQWQNEGVGLDTLQKM